MAKKFTASSQQLKPDPKYHSKLVSKFINCLMLDGKKSTAQKVFNDAMDIMDKNIEDAGPLEIFEKATAYSAEGSSGFGVRLLTTYLMNLGK